MGGYVTMVVAIFLIVFTATTLQSQDKPMALTTHKEASKAAALTGNFTPTLQACKNVSESEAKIHQFYPITGMIWHGGSTEDEVQIDDDNTTDYIQRRSSVPIPQIEFLGGAKFRHMQLIKDNVNLDGQNYEVYFPVKSGEFQSLEGSYMSKTRCEDPNDHDHCKEQHRIYFVDYELIFLRHMDASGNPVVVPGTETSGNEYNLADIYQSVKSVSDPKVGKLPEEAFDCSKLGQPPSPATASAQIVPTQRVFIPDQQESTSSEQLQLGWFVFGQQDEALIPQPVPQLAFDIGCKPAVYLYPPQKQLINVKVSPNGFLTYTDPLYDMKNGWNVEAYPDGKISNFEFRISNFKQYDYLYYESKIRDGAIEKPTKGWVMKSSGQEKAGNTDWFNPLEEKFNDVLPKLGLNQQQTKDFISYWKKALKPAPYYFIGVMDQDNINQFEKLEITPKPDSINRVRIYFERLDQPKTVEAPKLDIGNLKLDIGNSFRVVEWGGMVKNDPDHPFTCSQ